MIGADEYEKQLRDAVLAWWSESALRDYADWLRMRAVADSPCAFWFVRDFVKEIEAESWFPSLPDPPGPCACAAHQCRRLRDAQLREAETRLR